VTLIYYSEKAASFAFGIIQTGNLMHKQKNLNTEKSMDKK